MSTVQDLEQCKQCGEESAIVLFETRTWEENIFCYYCGHSHDYHIVRDDDGKPVMLNENEPKYNLTTSEGFGVAKLYPKGEVAGKMFLFDDDSDEIIKEFLQELNKTIYQDTSSYLTVYRNGKLEFLFGKKEEIYE